MGWSVRARLSNQLLAIRLKITVIILNRLVIQLHFVSFRLHVIVDFGANLMGII